MRYSRKSAGILSLLLLFNTIGMTACGHTAAEIANAGYNIIETENTQDSNDTVTMEPPNILVDQQGYASSGEKQAVVEDGQPVETFRLVNSKTGKSVYEGTIKQTKYNEETKRYIGIADFSDYIGEGDFYLECDNGGKSQTFSLQEDHYQELLTTLCKETRSRCQDGSITEDEVITLLEACEWYPQILADEDGNEIPDLLEAVADWLENEADSADAPEAENMRYVAVMAKFSYLYQKYDAQYAARCLQRATTVYTGLAAAAGRDAETFLALTELYRAAGLYTYRDRILEYKDFFTDNGNYPEETAYLYGAMTYLSTRRSVDMELCAAFVESIRSRGEELAKRSGNITDAAAGSNGGSEELLKQAEELACANYVLYSYQYTEILQDFLHYLMGRNRDSVSYYPEEGDAADYLLLIAQQVSLADKH